MYEDRITLFAYNNEEARVEPGADWQQAVERVRELRLAAANEMVILGALLAGAVGLQTGAKANIDEFINAAVPPLDGAEIRDFNHGFNKGMRQQRAFEGAQNV